MSRIDFLELLLTPLAAASEFKYPVWSLLTCCLVWLIARKLCGLQSVAYSLSMLIWFVLLSCGALAILLTLLLYILSPNGPDFYRVIFAFFAALPLVAAATVAIFLKPNTH